MTTTTSPNNVEPRTLNLEHSTSSVEPRTLNLEQSSPIEPRTLNLERPSLRFLDPVGYFDIIALEKSARMLLTPHSLRLTSPSSARATGAKTSSAITISSVY